MEGWRSCVIMDLLGACWMIRSLEQPIASISFDSDDNLVAGGWDGQIRKWNLDGDLLWTQVLPDRICDIVFCNDQIIVTSGLHIVNLDSITGEINWQKPLEGSADSLIVENDQIFVTSSVYDIEHNDFLESAIWNFSRSGTQNWVTRIDERPWVLLAHEEKIVAGLGRPISGWAEVLVDGEIVNHQLDTDSPVMCGTLSHDGVIFGHADGTVSSEKGVKNKFAESVENLDSKDGLYVASLEGGGLVAIGESGVQVWDQPGEPISAQSIGFTLSKIKTHWTTRWDEFSGLLEVRDANTGELIAQATAPQSSIISANESRVAVGDVNGKIHVWEKEMFDRRLTSKGAEESKSSQQRSALKDKLRALRNR
jgi:WD40 repeat protein